MKGATWLHDIARPQGNRFEEVDSPVDMIYRPPVIMTFSKNRSSVLFFPRDDMSKVYYLA